MGRYGSLSEFRAALNGLVDATGTTRRNPRRRKKARRNMAVRALPGGGFEADTPEEMVALMRQMGGGGFGQAAPAPSPGGFGAAMRAAPPKRKASRERKLRGAFTGELRDPGGPPSYKQAQLIGMSIGGMAAYCPQYASQKVSHKQALTEMGLTKGSAMAVLDALSAAGVLRPHRGVQTTAAQQAQARQILAEVGGVVCPTAASNPYYRY